MRMLWKDHEVFELLKIIHKSFMPLLFNPKLKRNKRIYEAIAKELYSKRFVRSPLQIRVKFKSLKAEYNRNKRNNITNSVLETLQFYDLLREILENGPKSVEEGVDTCNPTFEFEQDESATGSSFSDAKFEDEQMEAETDALYFSESEEQVISETKEPSRKLSSALKSDQEEDSNAVHTARLLPPTERLNSDQQKQSNQFYEISHLLAASMKLFAESSKIQADAAKAHASALEKVVEGLNAISNIATAQTAHSTRQLALLEKMVEMLGRALPGKQE